MLHTLGSLELDGATLGRPKPLLLLAYLALEGPQDRAFLRQLFWPENQDAAGRLRVTLGRLQQGAPGAFGTHGTMLSACVSVDAHLLLQASSQSQDQQILDLYAAPFLKGVDVPPLGVELEEWVFRTRELLASCVRGTFLRLAERSARLGEYHSAAQMAYRAYVLSDAPEPEVGDLKTIHSLLLAGEHPAATAVLREAGPFASDTPEDVSFARAQWSAQQATSGAASAPRLTNLPRRREVLVGRGRDLERALATLRDIEGTWLTITGPGGIGKTHLAREVAQALLATGQFPDGVFWIGGQDLTTVPALIVRTLEMLGTPRSAGAEDEVLLLRHLETRTLLLVFDNAEQIPGAGDLVAKLLRGCPNLKVVVTSRERLHGREEWVLPLEGLSTVRQERQSASEAATLFATRMRRVQLDEADFNTLKGTLNAIGECLQGIPLALELAASWTHTITPAFILAELQRDSRMLDTTASKDARQGSMRTMFEGSWERLKPSEQESLAGIAVFQGGFSHEAATAVVQVALPTLAMLVNKSLLRSHEGRFDFHPLLQRYALEKLESVQVRLTEVRQLHRRYFLQLVREKNLYPFPAHDFTNLRAAWWDACQTQDCAELESSARFVQGEILRSTRMTEGLEWFEEALRVTEADGMLSTRSELLISMAWLSFQAGQLANASTQVKRGMRDLEQGKLQRSQSYLRGLHVGASLAFQTGEMEEAGKLWRNAEELSRLLGDGETLGRMLECLAILDQHLGHFKKAEDYYLELLPLRKTGRSVEYARTLTNFALLKIEQEQFGRACELLNEGLSAIDVGHERLFAAQIRNNLALALFMVGDLEQGLRVCSEGLTQMRHEEHALVVVSLLDTRSKIFIAMSEFQAAAADLSVSLKHARTAGSNPTILKRLVSVAELLWASSFKADAVQLLQQLLELPQIDPQTYRSAENLLRSTFGQERALKTLIFRDLDQVVDNYVEKLHNLKF